MTKREIKKNLLLKRNALVHVQKLSIEEQTLDRCSPIDIASRLLIRVLANLWHSQLPFLLETEPPNFLETAPTLYSSSSVCKLNNEIRKN